MSSLERRRRVRTGCRTCKIRRVKCDEARPACGRCTSTGRACDGYVSVAQKPSVTISGNGAIPREPLGVLIGSPSNSLLTLDGDRCDLEAFHFFRFQCTANLAGHFDDGFWRRTVLQLSHQDPAIRHSILALSCQLRASSVSSCPENNKRLATRHYLKAIDDLNKKIPTIYANSPESNTLVLIVCILFIGFEVLRGNQEAALMHLLSGLAISKSTKATSGSNTKIEGPENDEVSKMLGRFDVQAATWASLYSNANVHVPILPASFNTLHQARDALISILAMQQLWLRSQAHQFKYADSVPTEVIAQQQAIESLLRRWSKLLLRFMKTSPCSILAGQILGAQYFAALIRIKTSLLPTESAYDVANADFFHIVSLSEAVIKIRQGAEDAGEPNFTFEMGIIQPLYFTACKCRLPAVRRQAVELLGNAGQEGVWNGRTMQAVAVFVMDLEEQGISERRINEPQRVHGTEVQTDFERRTAKVICSTREGHTGKWVFTAGSVSW